MEEGDSSGFIYLSRHEDSELLMAPSVETSPTGMDTKKRLMLGMESGLRPHEENWQRHSNRPTMGSLSQIMERSYVSRSQCTIHCDSSDDGQENVDYCEDDEARLNPEDHNLSMEEGHSEPYFELGPSSETLFNLTTTSPQKSPTRLL